MVDQRGPVEIPETLQDEQQSKTRRLSGGWAVAVGVLAAVFTFYYLYTAKFGIHSPEANRGLYVGLTYVLVLLLYPAYRGAPRDRIPWYDVLLALAALGITGYLIYFWPEIVSRAGMPNLPDLILGGVAILLTLEVARRAMGKFMTILGILFIVYSFAGPYLPGLLAHKGYSLTRFLGFQYTSFNGIYGVVAQIFATYVFLFLIFGTFLEKSGAARFFIELPYALAGRLRGGPAKVAVIVSGLMGSISGSAVANVLTTGTFTIPLMKRTGYKPHVAAAIETAASTGGQIMPPLMGAGAFLIAEFTGMTYWDVVRVSFIPAILYYFSVYMMVDLEAAKEGLKGLAKKELPDPWEILKGGWFYFVPVALIIYLLMAGYTPAAAGFWATVSTVALGLVNPRHRFTLADAWQAASEAAVRSLPVGAAVGVIGIIIGVTQLTGLGLKFSDIVVSLSGGYLILALILVTLASYVLGMGLTVTSSYIILAILAAPALSELGVPLLAAHLIIFWVSQDANLTPPVCLAAFAAAGIADSDPMKTGWTSWKFGRGLYIPPLLMAYTPAFLLNGTPAEIITITISATLGIIAFSSGFVNFMIRPFKIWERVLVFVAGGLLVTPEWTTDLTGALLLAFLWVLQGGPTAVFSRFQASSRPA